MSKIDFLCFMYWMNRWTKIECLALFALKLGDENIEHDDFNILKSSDKYINRILKAYRDELSVEGQQCRICDQYCYRDLCPNCERAIVRIIANEPIITYKMKGEYSAIEVVIPFYGESSDDEMIAVCGQNISTFMVESSYSNFHITKYFSKEMNYSGACEMCYVPTIKHFCDYHMKIYDKFVDKLYYIYLALRSCLIADVSRAMFLDIYVSYATLLDFY